MKLSKREVILLALLLVGLLIYSFYFFYNKTKQQTDALMVMNTQLKSDLDQAQGVYKGKVQLNTGAETLKNNYKGLVTKIPEQPYVPELIMFFNQAATESQVTIKSFNYSDSNAGSLPSSAIIQPGTGSVQTGANSNSAGTQPGNTSVLNGNTNVKTNTTDNQAKGNSAGSPELELNASGTYYSLLSYILKIERAPRIYIISSATFTSSPRKETGGGGPPLTGSALYDGSNMTLALKFKTYYDFSSPQDITGVDDPVAATEGGKNPFGQYGAPAQASGLMGQ